MDDQRFQRFGRRGYGPSSIQQWRLLIRYRAIRAREAMVLEREGGWLRIYSHRPRLRVVRRWRRVWPR